MLFHSITGPLKVLNYFVKFSSLLSQFSTILSVSQLYCPSTGAGLIANAVIGTLFILATNTLLRPLVNYISRLPLDANSLEVTNILHIIASNDQRQSAMVALEKILKSTSYPLSALDIAPFGIEEIEIEATLMTTSITNDDMDLLITLLNIEPSIRQAFWELSTS